ncbi:MAG: diguanylate cyclase [Saprospiraceae bacterium]|nr:diguanylate cyclase [Saprospiraceae bacterium]
MRQALCISFLLLCGTLTSCTREEDVIARQTEEKLAALVQQFTTKKTEECTRKMQQDIERLADSVLIVLSKRIKYDSLTIPVDSVRPEKPEVSFPEYRPPQKPD